MSSIAPSRRKRKGNKRHVNEVCVSDRRGAVVVAMPPSQAEATVCGGVERCDFVPLCAAAWNGVTLTGSAGVGESVR